MKVLMTGGHHSSALPVIKNLRIRYPDVSLYWLGHKYSLKGDKNVTLEYKEITSLGIEFTEIRTAKVYKSYNPIKLLKLFVGFAQSYRALRLIKPDIIVSFGGYLAVPVVIVGKFLSIPSITHEQTLVSGYANRVISKFVQKIMISWESSAKYFNTDKVVFTGIPLREEIFQSNSNAFKFENALPSLLILGGKTGSHIINKFIISNLGVLLKDYNIIHQCGDNSIHRDYDEAVKKYESLAEPPRGTYVVRKFIFSDEIGEAYAEADIVISRSGAHTIAELASLGKKAILIPIPWVSHNEQMENALYLAKKGNAVIIKENELSLEKLVECILELHSGPVVEVDKFKNDAAERIVNEIVETIEKVKRK